MTLRCTLGYKYSIIHQVIVGNFITQNFQPKKGQLLLFKKFLCFALVTRQSRPITRNNLLVMLKPIN